MVVDGEVVGRVDEGARAAAVVMDEEAVPQVGVVLELWVGVALVVVAVAARVVGRQRVGRHCVV